MRNLLVVLFFTSFLISSIAQEKRIDKNIIPDQVKSYQQSNYPLAKHIEYYKKKERDSVFYEMEFEMNKQEYNLRFSLQGNLLETEREIELDEMPAPVKESITSILNENFRKARIRKIQEVNPVGRKQFELYIKAKKSHKFKSGFYKVMFDGSGNLRSIEKDKLNSIESVF
jgi:hypothetical protein